MTYKNERVEVTGGYGISEYKVLGYCTGKNYPDDAEMHEVHLDNGSFHYYLESQIQEVIDINTI